MKISSFFVTILLGIFFFSCCSCSDKIDLTNAGIMSEYFVKERLKNPDEVKFTGGYRGEQVSDTEFLVYQKVSTKNDFGVRKSMVYKIHMIYKGGDWAEQKNWTYDLLIIEEVDTGKQYKYYSPNDR